MSKLTLLVAVAIAAGLFGGVLEVKVRPEKLSALPGALLNLAQSDSLYEKGRHWAVSLKRAGEFFIIKDEKQQLELAIGYINADAERLNTLIENDKSAEHIMPQAELLTLSIERAGDLAAKAHVDNLAAFQQDTKKAFNNAALTVHRLQEMHASYQALEEKFAGIVSSLEKQIGTLADTSEGEVAGTKDESAPDASASPTIPAIQLNF